MGINIELNMNLIPLKDLKILSAMIHLTEYSENRTAYGKLDDLFDRISLGIEDGTQMLMVKKLCKSWSQ